MIPLFFPYIPKKRILKEILETLNGRIVGQGPKVDLFEKRFGEKFRYKYPLFLNSGTSALELAYHLLDLKKNDKVVVPVLDSPCGQVGLLRRECKVLFCDIERDTLNIDPVFLEKLLQNNKVRAVVGVHLGGIHFNKKIYSVCKRYQVPLIVDSAQYHAQTKGDYICYSFQAIKHITTGDGGMLVLNSQNEYARAKKLRWFGIPRNKKYNPPSWKGREITHDIQEAGYKFQPTDIDACLGLAALPDLDKVIMYRKKLVLEYTKRLKVQMVAGDTCWLIGILTEHRNQLANFLVNKGIEVNLVHSRNDLLTVFGGKRQKFPNMDWIESRYLYLPLNNKLTINNIKYICKIINQFYEQA